VGEAGASDNRRVHLVIAFASPPAPPGGGRAPVPPGLRLPRLERWLGAAVADGRDEGDEHSFSPPHERALASALGWPVGPAHDGRLPLAAWWAQREGVASAPREDTAEAARACGLVTPCHWHLGTDQVSLVDPAGLMLDEAAALALHEAVRPSFEHLGATLHYAAPTRWFAEHPGLAALATASLDRVAGRNVDAWLGDPKPARPWRRLQSEVQMLLHTHPVNADREARGLLPVNSLWLSGCGAVPAGAAVPAGRTPPVLDTRLREPFLAGDLAAWCRAWETLDEGPVAALANSAASDDDAPSLTLCGERHAARFAARASPLRWWHRFAPRRAPPLPALLAGL
jgi:hypothetical protein